jgi:glutamate racemase
MSKQQMPVLVFDSGLGGISVLKELIRLMPEENYIYFGDSQNAPYGPKSSAEVCDLTLTSIRSLVGNPAKAMVIACNTATSAAINVLREAYPTLPVIGIEPAIKPAAMQTMHGRILVMATEMTLREKKFKQLLAKYRGEAETINLAAPGIVELVERGVTEGPELDAYLDQLLRPYRKRRLDAIVLGCTHFPFVRDSILAALGYEPAIYDGLLGTARETQRQLISRDLLNPGPGPGNIEFYNSRGGGEIIALCEKLLHA